MDDQGFPPLRVADAGTGKARGIQRPRFAPPPKEKARQLPPTTRSADVAAAAVQRARSETHGTRSVARVYSDRSDEIEKKPIPVEQIMVHNERYGEGIPGSLRTSPRDTALWGCTVAEISPSAITPAPATPSGETGIGFLLGDGESEVEAPYSVQEPPALGKEHRQPANAWRPALKSPRVPINVPSQSHDSTAESSSQKHRPTYK